MFSLQCTMLQAMTVEHTYRKLMDRKYGKAFYWIILLFSRIYRAGTSISLSICMINTWYICCISGQVGELDVHWSEVVSYRGCWPMCRHRAGTLCWDYKLRIIQFKNRTAMKKYMNVFTDPVLLVVATITINAIPISLTCTPGHQFTLESLSLPLLAFHQTNF